MEDCACQRIQLMPTKLTDIALARANAVKVCLFVAIRALLHIPVTALKHLLNTGLIIGKLLVKLCNGVLHGITLIL